MKTKSSGTIRLILLLVIAVMVAGAFYYGYLPLLNQRDQIYEENKQLQLEVYELDKKIAQQAEYEAVTKASLERIQTIFGRYAAGQSPEKNILFIDGLEKNVGVEINSISFSSEAPFYSSSQLPAVYENGVTGTTSTLGISYSVSYQNFKKMLAYLAAYPERVNLGNISATYNSDTGMLSGSTVINLYTLTGTGKEYIPPVVGGIDIGKRNIFGTAETETGETETAKTETAEIIAAETEAAKAILDQLTELNGNGSVEGLPEGIDAGSLENQIVDMVSDMLENLKQ